MVPVDVAPDEPLVGMKRLRGKPMPRVIGMGDHAP